MDITQQSSLYLSPTDLNKMYWKLLRNPNFVQKLDAFQKTELREYAEDIKSSACELAKGIMLKNPAYNYPEAYRGNEFEYWMDTMSTGRESRQALQLLAEKPVAETPAAVPESRAASDLVTPLLINDQLEAIVFEDYLAEKCSVDLCDKAAAKAGLRVGKGAHKFADLRVHALVAALKETRSLQSSSIGIADFRAALAERYSIFDYNMNYRPQHGKGTGPSRRIEKWDDVYNVVHLFLKNHYEQERRKK